MRKIKRKNQKRNKYKVDFSFFVRELRDVDFYNASSKEFKLIEIVLRGELK